ncbi:cuticle protein 7-like [Zootermopsis nevadensis]|uniref:Cuticle protein 7 n=1 Tax=Zootermopsis nevadensis TaxID=136037 RepID=A0A067R7L8_ZOONE|nr:cuticle protein 7-like [Zootermopsis nevadensis]KDR19385.1 Cuticle protein 7 [Zootermopsis nevadensis]
MKILVVFSAIVACAFAKPGLLAAGALGYAAPAIAAPVAYAAPVGYAAPVAYAAPATVSVRTQYHAQDVLGQASYGHAEPLQTHNAIQDAAGNKIGSFSYVSPEGQVLRTDYVADALGYRVASNALPVGPSLSVATHGAIVHRARRQILGHTPAATTPLVAPVAYAAPLSYHTAAVRPGILTNVVNTPGHAVSYRID